MTWTQRIDIRRADEVGRLAELDQAVTLRSPQDTLSASFETLRTTVLAVTAERHGLSMTGREGRLDARGTAAALKGAYSSLIAGVNDMLDAVLSPIGEATTVLEKWATRDLRARVAGNYAGEHARSKDAMNARTFGEMIFFPTSVAYVAELAPQGKTGEYMGMFSAAISLAVIVGPWLGAFMLDRVGAPRTWSTMFALGACATALFVFSSRTRHRLDSTHA